MTSKKNLLLSIVLFNILFLGCTFGTNSQQLDDSIKITELTKVTILGFVSKNGIGHLNEIQPPYIYSGKKTEVIVVDSVDANKAINNTRQILGKIPGLYIVESETGGFVANG